MNFPFLKKKKEHALILDLGTEAIKALIIEKRNDKTVVLGAALEYLKRSPIIPTETLKKSILRTTALVQDKTKITPRSVILGLPADILKTRVFSQNHQRKTPKTVINLLEENDIYKKVIKKSKQKIAQRFSEESGIIPTDISFIEIKVLEIKIDGYPVSTIKGFSGRNLEFRILTVFLPKHMEKYGDCGWEFFEKIIQNLGWKLTEITYPLPAVMSISKDAVLLDIGGTLTQITLIKNGKLEKIAEFKLGGEDLSRTISQALGISLERARLLKHKYVGKILSEPARAKIREILAPCIQEWFTLLNSKLSSNNNLVPKNIFLLGGGSLLPEIPEALTEKNWQNIIFPGKIKVKHLYPQDLKLASEEFIINSNTPQYTPSILLCGEKFKYD